MGRESHPMKKMIISAHGATAKDSSNKQYNAKRQKVKMLIDWMDKAIDIMLTLIVFVLIFSIINKPEK